MKRAILILLSLVAILLIGYLFSRFRATVLLLSLILPFLALFLVKKKPLYSGHDYFSTALLFVFAFNLFVSYKILYELPYHTYDLSSQVLKGHTEYEKMEVEEEEGDQIIYQDVPVFIPHKGQHSTNWIKGSLITLLIISPASIFILIGVAAKKGKKPSRPRRNRRSSNTPE